MTNYKSLDSSDFGTEVQTKITLQDSNIKISALLNDYEHKVEAEPQVPSFIGARIWTRLYFSISGWI